MEQLAMQVLLSVAVAVGISILGRMPYEVAKIDPRWVSAAMLGVIMVNTSYAALYQHSIREELRDLNRTLMDPNRVNPELRGTLSRLLTISKGLRR